MTISILKAQYWNNIIKYAKMTLGLFGDVNVIIENKITIVEIAWIFWNTH